jgi:hypothetical protein
MAEEVTDIKTEEATSGDVAATPEAPAEKDEVNQDSSNVQITEEPVSASKPINEEEQPKPIVEEPNPCPPPELNVVPEETPSENTVITEIVEPTPTDKVEQPAQPTPPSKDVLDTALESAAEKPAPAKKSFIIRDSEAPDLPPAANTIFILDLMKQRQEKIRRKKKDDIIHEMALKMKKEKEEAKRKGRQPSYNYNSGGFVGVLHLITEKPATGKSPQLHRKAVMDEMVAVPSTGESRAIFEG